MNEPHRPGVLIGLFGFSYCHRVSPLYDDLQIDSEIGGPYVELKVEAAKRFALQKNFLEVYTDLALRREFAGYLPLKFDIGICYGL